MFQPQHIETQIICSLFNFGDPKSKKSKKSKRSKKSKKSTQSNNNHKSCKVIEYKHKWFDNDADMEDEYNFKKGDKQIQPPIIYTKHYKERFNTRNCIDGEKMYTVMRYNVAVTTYPVEKHILKNTRSKNIYSHKRGHY